MAKSELTERFLQAYNTLLKQTPALTLKDFTSSIGVSPSLMTEMRKGRSDVGVKALQNIVIAYNISPEWLLLGEGEMMRSAQPSSKSTDTPPSTDNTEIEQLRQEVQRLKDEKIKLLEKIISLQDTH
jgi:transcriptional regulator with XRE-family HTH domain